MADNEARKKCNQKILTANTFGLNKCTSAKNNSVS